MKNGQEEKTGESSLVNFCSLTLEEYAIFYEVVNFRYKFIFEFSCFPAPGKSSGLAVVALSILSTSLQTMKNYVESNQDE